MAFLLDTNIISEPIRPEPNPSIIAKLREHSSNCAMPSTVWHELQFGLQRIPNSRRKTEVARYFDEVVRRTIPILNYDEAAALWHATARAQLEARGLTPSFADSQIASVAVINGLILVTRNTKDFANFDIQLEDWADAS